MNTHIEGTQEEVEEQDLSEKFIFLRTGTESQRSLRSVQVNCEKNLNWKWPLKTS